MKSGLAGSRKIGSGDRGAVAVVFLVFFAVFLLMALSAWAGDLSETLKSNDAIQSKLSNVKHLIKGVHIKERSDDQGKNYKEDEILVKFKAEASEQSKKRLHKKRGSEKIREFSSLHIHHMKLQKGLSVKDAIKLYQDDSDVEYAEPNYRVTVQATPNDPLFGQLWGLNNTGLDADIDAPEAWDITKGSSNVVVAVIDTGVDYNHEDLSVNMWKNTGEIPGNGIDDDGNGYIDDVYGIDAVNYDRDPFDDHGHGTHVSGTIGAVGSNNLGVAGVNWNIKIMACKFLNSGGYGYMDGAVACLNYIKMMKDRGVNVIATNNSWGCDGGGCYSHALYDAINTQRDILFIAAAGNSSLNLDQAESYPAKYDLPNVIAVAAINSSDNLAYFSSYGKHWVHVGAPGENILSTLPAVNTWNISGGYGYLSGTSMATPHVTGLAGLLKGQDTSRDSWAVKNLILYGSESTNSLSDVTIMGGRINANNSVRCDTSYTLPRLKVLRYPETLSVGTPVTLSALSIRCGAASGPVTVTLSGGEVIDLHDDGVAPDLAAGDGIFSATWTPIRDPEKLVFSSPDAAPITITAPALYIAHYLPEANTRVPYHQYLTAVGAKAPYSWSLLSGSLPSGLTLNSSTGEISGNPVSTGTFSFTVQVSDGWGTSVTRTIPLRVSDGDIREEFARTLHGAAGASGRDIALDASGNIHILGTLSGYNYITKYDASGTLLWLKPYETGYLRALALDATGNIYVAGGTAEWDTGDTLLVKFDSSGNKVWEKTYNNAQRTDVAMDIALDNSGNIYLGGISDSGFSDSMYAQKIDSSGNALWFKTYSQGMADYGYAITVDNAGNVILGGSSAIGVPDQGGTAYWYDTVIRKYDPSGNLIWHRTYDTGSRYDFLSDLKVDGNGNVYALDNPEEGAYTAFVTMKYNAAGDLLWVRNYQSISHYPEALAVDQQGNVYATGGSWQETATADWDFLTLKYDASGNLLWKKVSDSGYYVSPYDGDVAYGIAVDAGGNVLVVGSSNNGFGSYDMLLIKYSGLFMIETGFLPAGVVNIVYSQTLSASGGVQPYTWSLTEGSLPPGLSLNSGTGQISGVPTAAGDYTFTAQVTDANAAVRTKTFTLPVIVNEPLLITTPSLSWGTIGIAYNQTLTAMGGMPPYTWSIVSGSLPSGLYLNSLNGTIFGNPQTVGTFGFTARVTDAYGAAVTKDFSIAIYEPLSIIIPSLPDGAVGAPYNQTLIAAGGALPYTWSVISGGLPPGITLDASTGVISGIAGSAGTFSFTAQVMDANSSTCVRGYSLFIAGSGIPGQLTWMNKAWMPVPTSRAASAAVNGKIYVLGGTGSNVFMYDPLSDSWQSMPPLIEPKFVPAEAAQGDIIYLAGGSTPSILAYNTSTGSSQSIGSLTTERFRASAAILNNKLYVVGGSGGSGLGSIDEFDLATNTVVVKATLPSPRELPAVIAVGQKIYIIGGANSSGYPTSTCWEYDPALNTFMLKRLLPYPIMGSVVETLNGKIYIIGGVTSIGFPPTEWTSIVLEYDPVANTVQDLGPFPTSRYALMTGIVNNTLYAIGGDNGLGAVAVNEAAVLSGEAVPGTGVSSWGANYFGQLGDGTNNSSDVPVPVIGLDNVTALAAPMDSSLALKSDGTVWGWGDNMFGQLGDGSYSNKNAPVPITGISSVWSIAAGWFHSLAIGTDGTLWRWGNYSSSGWVNFPDLVSLDSNIPVQVMNVPGIPALPPLAVAGGGWHSLVLNFDGTIWTWGANTYGQLGNGTTINSTVPVQAIGLDNIVYISAGIEHSVALKVDGTVWTWGNNTDGQLGNGSNMSSSVPVQVAGLNNVIAIFGGGWHTIALKGDGTVWTWGRNLDGQLGDGTTTNSSVPVQVHGLSGVTAINGKCFRSIALKADGTVWTWGRAYTSNSTVPVQVAGLNNIAAIAAGMDHTIVLKAPANAPLTITTPSLSSGAKGTSYYQSMSAAGGLLPYSWTIISGSLPNGLILNSATGEISGTPTTAGTFNFTIQVMDAVSATAVKDFSIIIANPNPDLLVSSLTVPSTAGAGTSITVTDTTKNNGPGDAGASTTRFYLSTDSTLDGTDTQLNGSRAVPALAAGESSSGTASATIPADTPAGSYYVIAKADADGMVVETREDNNTKYSSTIKIGPDLVISAVTAPSTAGAGMTIAITDTTKNNGPGDAGASTTRFYLSTDSTLDGADTQLNGSRAVPALAAGAIDSGSTLVTIPTGTLTGAYYVIARADADDMIVETSETNNTKYSTTMKIGPDFTVTAVTAPATAGAGTTISVTDTTKNSGASDADPSTTSFYLSTDSILDSNDALLGSRSVGSIAAGASSSGTTSVTIPTGTPSGSYYVIARADADDMVFETREDNNTKYSTTIKIGPDLIVSAVTAPSTAGAGKSISVTDTTKNSGAGDVASSSTGFYLSTDSTLDEADVKIGSRTVDALVAGASSSGTASALIPTGTPSGSYYIIARADADDMVFETREDNNTKYSTTIKIGPDLIVSAVTAPSTAGAGKSIFVTDTTKNSGAGDAASSSTGYYLSTDSTLDGADVKIGSRTVDALVAGASSSGTASALIPTGTPSGSYYVIARADADDMVVETREDNNTKYSTTIKIGPDLVVSAVTAPSTGGAGTSITVTDTTKNSGAGDAASSSTGYYLSTDSTLDGADVKIGSRTVDALAAGASISGTTSVTIPTGTLTGSYYIIAKADGDDLIPETSETNNTKYSTSIKIGPDFTVTAVVAPATAGAGTSITATDTTKNSGAGDAVSSATAFYLSTDTTLDASDTKIGSRAVEALAPGASSSGTASALIPIGTPSGSYYIIATADGDDLIPETSETNNAKYSTSIKIGPDLTVYSMTAPSSAKIGATISVTDTSMNSGAGEAASSTTGFYLSTDTNLDAADTMIGSRAVVALASGAGSSGTTSVTIPTGTLTGTYYIISKADAEGLVTETSETNNTRYKSINITVP